MTGGFRERTTTFSYLPEARPVIAALRRLGNVIEAAQLNTFKDSFAPDRFALATICEHEAAVEALKLALVDAVKDNPRAIDLVQVALVLQTDAGYIVAFPAIVAAPIRVLG